MDFDIKEIHLNWLADADNSKFYFNLIDCVRNIGLGRVDNTELGKLCIDGHDIYVRYKKEDNYIISGDPVKYKILVGFVEIEPTIGHDVKILNLKELLSVNTKVLIGCKFDDWVVLKFILQSKKHLGVRTVIFSNELNKGPTNINQRGFLQIVKKICAQSYEDIKLSESKNVQDWVYQTHYYDLKTDGMKITVYKNDIFVDKCQTQERFVISLSTVDNFFKQKENLCDCDIEEVQQRKIDAAILAMKNFLCEFIQKHPHALIVLTGYGVGGHILNHFNYKYISGRNSKMEQHLRDAVSIVTFNSKKIFRKNDEFDYDMVMNCRDICSESYYYIQGDEKPVLKDYLFYEGSKEYQNGFYSVAFRDTINRRIIIAYRGSDDNPADWFLSDFPIVFHRYPDQFEDAVNMLAYYTKKFGHKGYKFVLTGHSLGGGLAQLAGIDKHRKMKENYKNENCEKENYESDYLRVITFNPISTRDVVNEDREEINKDEEKEFCQFMLNLVNGHDMVAQIIKQPGRVKTIKIQNDDKYKRNDDVIRKAQTAYKGYSAIKKFLGKFNLLKINLNKLFFTYDFIVVSCFIFFGLIFFPLSYALFDKPYHLVTKHFSGEVKFLFNVFVISLIAFIALRLRVAFKSKFLEIMIFFTQMIVLLIGGYLIVDFIKHINEDGGRLIKIIILALIVGISMIVGGKLKNIFESFSYTHNYRKMVFENENINDSTEECP